MEETNKAQPLPAGETQREPLPHGVAEEQRLSQDHGPRVHRRPWDDF